MADDVADEGVRAVALWRDLQHTERRNCTNVSDEGVRAVAEHSDDLCETGLCLVPVMCEVARALS